MLQSPSKRLALLALSAGHFVVDMQSSGLAILIPLLRTNLGLDYASAAGIMTAQYLTSSVIQPLFGMISDRRPMREILPLACLCAGTGVALAMFMPAYALVLLVVLLTGFGSASFHAVGALNTNHLSGGNKATGMSYFFAGGQLGYAVGPLFLVALMKALGTDGVLFSLVPAVLGAGVLVWALPAFMTSRDLQARKRVGAVGGQRAGIERRAAWGMTVVVVVIALRSVIQTGLITFIPLYFADLGPQYKDYSALLISIFVFSGAIGTLFGGALADRFGRKAVLSVSLGIVMPLLVVFLSTSGPLQVLSIGVAGASLISASSLMVVMAQELLPNNIGLASGLTLGLGFGAGGVGAAILGGVADTYGLPVTMWTIAFLPTVLVLLTFLLPGRPVPQRYAPIHS